MLLYGQIDYLQAFPQAPIDSDVYLRIPWGWKYNPDEKKIDQQLDNSSYNDTNWYIKLKKNVYGTKQAAANFYDYLCKDLLAIELLLSIDCRGQPHWHVFGERHLAGDVRCMLGRYVHQELR